MSEVKTGHRLVLCNCPPDKAAGIAEKLVQERLAACVNIVPAVQSVYTWKGQLCHDTESTLLVKTRASLVDALTRRIVELHPYELPEVIALELRPGEGEPRYFAWLDEVTG
jgi:periplasmic divalent cation tolerance protein